MAVADQVISNSERGVNYSTRVDKISTQAKIGRGVQIVLALLVAVVMLIPVFWMGATAFKDRADVIAVPPKVVFTPTLEGFINLLTDRSVLNAARIKRMQARIDELNWYEKIALAGGQQITGMSANASRLLNSFIIAGVSTVLAVVLGLLAAYAFSRFKVPGESDWLFFILSTRMLPPVVVTIPIFLMYRELGLHDTHLGLILLYTVFNLSLTVWLLKGFMDEIPREYEDAAMVDGYTRLQAYAFALMLTSDNARTAPPTIPTILGRGGMEWGAIAAGSLAFLIPVVIVTFVLRKHLLRGVTFGAIRQ